MVKSGDKVSAVTGGRGKHGSKTSRTGLVFSTGRVGSALRKKVGGRVSAGTKIALTAILEYITAEVTEIAGNCAKDCKHKRIVLRDIMLGVRTDVELSKLFQAGTFARSGVVPNIQAALMPKKKIAKEAAQAAAESNN